MKKIIIEVLDCEFVNILFEDSNVCFYSVPKDYAGKFIHEDLNPTDSALLELEYLKKIKAKFPLSKTENKRLRELEKKIIKPQNKSG